MGHGGYDTVVVDLQHGMLYLEQAMAMLAALSSTPAMPMVRVSENQFFEVNKLLDAGAYGVICPMIDDVEAARRFVGACRYQPLGTRSYGPTRGFLYGGPDYFSGANDEILTLGMIETPQGLDNVDAIAAVEGLDGLFIGPADLSIALGARARRRLAQRSHSPTRSTGSSRAPGATARWPASTAPACPSRGHEAEGLRLPQPQQRRGDVAGDRRRLGQRAARRMTAGANRRG